MKEYFSGDGKQYVFTGKMYELYNLIQERKENLRP